MLNKRTAASISLILLLAFSFVPPQPVHAGAVIQVSSTPKGLEFAPDEYNVNTGFCSLREAIVAANTNKAFGGCKAGSGDDTIVIPAGKYRLTIAGNDDDSAKGDLDIKDNTTLAGSGSGTGGTLVTMVRSVSDRVFEITTPGKNVTFRDLRISGGYVGDKGGGGIFNNGATLNLDRVVITENSGSTGSFGGGIAQFSGSKLTINNSVISSNVAGYGGGIYNGGKLVITNSLINKNSVFNTGGGIDNVSPISPNDTASVTNSTIADNYNLSQIGGAGITNSGTFTLVNSTVVDNKGAGLFLTAFKMTVRNSIIARNLVVGSVLNCYVASKEQLISAGYNLVGENNSAGACTFAGSSDQVGIIDGELFLASAVANNGGPTQTYKLLTGSPAIDKIPAAGAACPPTDQRGYTRPAGKLCDIGAYEAGAVAPVLDKKVFLPLVVNP